MSLLREIQNTAIDSNADLASLLRKCKILAARLGNSEFKQWVERELSGYQSINDLPDYRILNVHSRGHFAGPFGSGLRNADIPMSCIPKEFHKNLKHSYFMQPVASIEALVTGSDGTASEPWNPDLVAHVGQDIYQNMNCMQAWKVIPINSIIAVLDAIRNRILNFALEIEAEAPDAGDAPLNSNPVPQERVHQIFNTYITGNVQNIANGSENVSQQAEYTERETDELFSKLIEAVSKSEANSEATSELIELLEEMRANPKSPSFKEYYQKFISLLADHMQVLGPVVAPFLPSLSALIP